VVASRSRSTLRVYRKAKQNAQISQELVERTRALSILASLMRDTKN
jgi:hypothetical protein